MASASATRPRSPLSRSTRRRKRAAARRRAAREAAGRRGAPDRGSRRRRDASASPSRASRRLPGHGWRWAWRGREAGWSRTAAPPAARARLRSAVVAHDPDSPTAARLGPCRRRRGNIAQARLPRSPEAAANGRSTDGLQQRDVGLVRLELRDDARRVLDEVRRRMNQTYSPVACSRPSWRAAPRPTPLRGGSRARADRARRSRRAPQVRGHRRRHRPRPPRRSGHVLAEDRARQGSRKACSRCAARTKLSLGAIGWQATP